MAENILGCKVRDVVTGFTGVATTVAEHLTGCRRVWVEGPTNDKGETQERWVDESRLQVLEREAVIVDAARVRSAPSPSDCGHPRG